MAAYKGAPPLRPMKVYPRLLGYCNVAEVVDVGVGVVGLNVGDRVYSHQSHRSEFVCDQSALITTPDGCDPAMMSTAYLYHLGYSALLKGRYKPGENLAVIGLGTLGLASVAVSRLMGASVLAVSGHAEVRDVAVSMGVDRVIGKDVEAVIDASAGMAGGSGIDLVVLTSSTWDDYRLALETVRPGGCVCMLGFPGREDPIPPFNPLDSRYFF